MYFKNFSFLEHQQELIISKFVPRYLAVCRPHLYREMQSRRWRALVYIAPAVLLAFIVNIPKWLEAKHFTKW